MAGRRNRDRVEALHRKPEHGAFPNDPTQWEDLDGDGFGDNLSGNNPDPYLFDFDNDGYNDSIDPLPKLASPGDRDADGVLDADDVFPEDYREWADADGDGEGDNADTDDVDHPQHQPYVIYHHKDY